jgi:hypothetical protein
MYFFMILALPGWLQPAPAASPPPVTCDAALAALFTPPRPVLGHYEVCTSAAPIERVIAARSPRDAVVEVLSPLDAFGAAGPYDRSTVSRLYGGTRVKVARSWQQEGDRFLATTLISPYPDPTLMHLIKGTMEIRWTTTR